MALLSFIRNLDKVNKLAGGYQRCLKWACRSYGPIHECRYLCFGGPIQDYQRQYSALAMGPFSYIDVAASVGPFGVGYGPIQNYRHRYSALAMCPFRYINIAALVGPFRIINAGIWRWLSAHSGISTLLPRWAHSGLSTLVFGVGYGTIQVYRRCCLGGPIQDYRHRYSALAMGPFRYIDIAASVGPFRIIDTVIRRWLWAHSGISMLLPRWAHSGLSTLVFGVGYWPFQVYRRCCLGGPIQDYRRRYSALAMGPFRIIDTGIRCWLWAHSGISTLLLWWAHSGVVM
jgi:hypothetical protein